MERRIDEICLLQEIQSLFHLFDKAMDIDFEEKKFNTTIIISLNLSGIL